MIRDARHSDVLEMVDLGYEMFLESRFAKYQYDHKKVTNLINGLIDSPLGFAIVSEDKYGNLNGGFIGIVFDHYFGPGLGSHDMALFVPRTNRGGMTGIALIKEYVKQAQRMGIDDINIGNTTGYEPEAVGALYERLGFQRVGGNFHFAGDN